MSPRIAFLGVGNYGRRYAARLIKAGSDVTVIARGSTLETLQSDGLHIPAGPFQPEAETISEVNVTGNPSEVGEVDLLIMSVKLYQLDEACRDAAPLVGTSTTIVPLSNGVDAPDRVARHFGIERVIGASTSGPMGIGEWPTGTSERTQQVASLFAESGIKVEHSDRVIDHVWWKFIVFAGNAPICAVARQPVGGVAAVPETVQMAMDATFEITAIASKIGITNAEQVGRRMTEYWEKMRPDFKPSMLVDLEAGRPLEMDAACATVVRLGEEHGVPTPVNRVLHAALKPYESGSPAQTT